MGKSIKSVIAKNVGTIHAGDVYVLNDPYAGGTHLPDITVITPVFDAAAKNILFYVVTRPPRRHWWFDARLCLT